LRRPVVFRCHVGRPVIRIAGEFAKVTRETSVKRRLLLDNAGRAFIWVRSPGLNWLGASATESSRGTISPY
jgi:hypothetical protein